MNLINITLDAFKVAVERYADSDNVNPRRRGRGNICAYIGEDDSHCLIGQIYLDLGGNLETLREADDNPYGVSGHKLFNCTFTIDLDLVINGLQAYADTKNRTWAEAIRKWKEVY